MPLFYIVFKTQALTLPDSSVTLESYCKRARNPLASLRGNALGNG